MRHVKTAALAMLLALSMTATARAVPSLTTHIDGFVDVNGNGVLDCGEPVSITTAFSTLRSGTPLLTGSMTMPAPGSSGLIYQPGSLSYDFSLTAGCFGFLTEGTGPDDPVARVDFTCPANPTDDQNSWIIVVHYKAAYYNAVTPLLTATATASTSDGETFNTTATFPAADICVGAPNALTVAKTAAGPGTPGSALLYTITATDTSGLGDGGLQFVDTVPPNTTFSAVASSPGWVCLPDGNPGSLCRNPVGNLSPNGSLSRFFAVTIDGTLPAGSVTIPNTACVRLGPTTVAGCASISTPATGTPMLHLAKTLTSGTGVPGATLSYALAATNPGNQGLMDAVVQETVPLHTTFSSGASSPGWTCTPDPTAGSACTFDLGALPAGGSHTVSFAVVVDNPLPPLPPGSTIANTGCLHTTIAGVADACSTVATPTAGMALLHLVKNVTAGTATPGSVLTYDLAVQNTGNEGASGVVVTETVPLHATFAPASSSPGWSCTSPSAGSSCSLAIGSVAAGTTIHASFAITVDKPLAAGVTALGNTACAASTPLEASTDACDTIMTPTMGHAVLTLSKSYSGNPARPGDLLVFQLVASNSGDQDTTGVAITETVPAHTTFVAASSSPGWVCTPGPAAGSTCSLTLATLPAGGSTSLTFAVQADANLPPTVQQIGNTACLKDANGITACGQATTPPAVSLVAELKYSFVVDANHNGLADPGDVIAYTLIVTNPTDGPAQSVRIATPLDTHLTLNVGSVTTTAGTITSGNATGDTEPVIQIPALAAGATVTIDFTGIVGGNLPPGLLFLSTQSALSGSNFPATVSSDPNNPVPLSPTTTPVGATTIHAIPTLTTWALVALGALLGTVSLHRIRATSGPKSTAT